MTQVNFLWLVFLAATPLAQLEPDQVTRCPPGQFLLGQTCIGCLPQTFMPEANHQHTMCFPCKRPKPGSAEIVLEVCTPTSDTHIGCPRGYTRVNRASANHGVCVKCEDCDSRQDSELKNGISREDTICCQHAAVDASQEGRDMCQLVTGQEESGGEVSIKCHRGHYLVISDTGTPSCLPCGEGEFMPEELHTFQTCRKCAQLEAGPHEIIVNCSRIQDTSLLCATGFYRVQPEPGHCTACLPCSTCGSDLPFEGQPCGTHSDTVCCPGRRMRVVQDVTGVYKCLPHPELTSIRTGLCSAGNFLTYNRQGLAICVPCDRGSYMPVGNHVNMNCKKCSEANESLHEVEMEECTATTDTVIGCQDGYFLSETKYPDLAENSIEDRAVLGRCQRCTVCQEHPSHKYTAMNCSQDADTFCCPEADMFVTLDDKGDKRCEASTSSPDVIIRCNQGHFLKFSLSGKPLCEPCPEGTYMDSDYHDNQYCKPCSQAVEFNMEIEIQPCTQTSDTIILCAEGHFRQTSRQDISALSGECTPCRNCSYEEHDKFTARTCHNYTDTICCSQNNMDVEEYENGTYRCKYPVDNDDSDISTLVNDLDKVRDHSCSTGEYPLFVISDTTYIVCRRCPPESNLTENVRVAAFCLNESVTASTWTHVPRGVARGGTCRTGEYMYPLQHRHRPRQQNMCVWCEHGTFMPEDYHRTTECAPCSVAAGKTASKNCTRTSDTVFSGTHHGGTAAGEHPLTTAMFFIVGAAISVVNGIRILFHHLSTAVTL